MNPPTWNGLGVSLGQLSRLADAQTRSLSPENPTGEKGAGARAEPPLDEQGRPTGPARDLGRGWKVRPCIPVADGETVTLADLAGPGAIQQIWLTATGNYRWQILRIYWDGQEHPSVECPLGDFFASAYTNFQTFAPLRSLAVCVNPGNAFNCYWEMPFRRHCRITLENLGPEPVTLFYQINYALCAVEEDRAYFHARFRRVNPLPYGQDHLILDGVRGCGHYVGTYLAWGVNNNGWWGEGEIKFFLDGDGEFPTICGTGTEDYFGGSYNFENKATHRYEEFTTPYSGLSQVVRPDGLYQSQTRFSLYRWHLTDPIRFARDLRVTIQALGWRAGGRYLPLQDDLSSVAFWYQTLPSLPFPPLPARDFLEII